MKHIGIFILLMVILSSCGAYITTITTSGDITLLNNNGEVIKQWEESTMSVDITSTEGGYIHSEHIGTPLKNGGINFTDKNGESHYVSGGIIIIDNIKTSTETEQIKKNTDGEIWPSSDN